MVGPNRDASYPLNEEQKRVAGAPWSLPQLVLAPPGTGKTHTVIARIHHLIDVCGLHPRREILVLCFTRAAVREIIRRLSDLVNGQQVNDDLRFATVRTFDSFTSRLLAATDSERDLSEKNFDERIRLLVDALRDPESEESSRVQDVRHLIVDEVQDLVGVRASLVQALLSRISGGFTLLGDPAQAIYGFSRRSPEDLDPAALLAWLRSQPWMQPLSEGGLKADYRTGPDSHSTRVAHAVRENLLTEAPQTDAALRRLREIIAGLQSSGTGLRPAAGISPEAIGQGSVCIVCRTNGEVLQIASMLASKNIPVFLKPRAEDSAPPAWIARVLGPFARDRISEREFLDRWAEHVAPTQGTDAASAWGMLKQVEAGDRHDLEIPLLHRRLRAGQRLPDDIDAYADAMDGALSLATIHSVKGREFDRVAILGPDDAALASEDQLEEARILYVAATRARTELTRLDRGHLPRIWRTDDAAGGRWVSHNSSGYYHVEAGLPHDFQVGSAVSEYQYADPNEAMAIQNYIWANVRPGDPIAVRRRFHRGFNFFDVLHGDHQQKVGGMSLAFVREIRGALNSCGRDGGRFPYPGVLKSLRVLAVMTEVLPFRTSKIHRPFDHSGFALGVRFRGMGYLAKED